MARKKVVFFILAKAKKNSERISFGKLEEVGESLGKGKKCLDYLFFDIF